MINNIKELAKDSVLYGASSVLSLCASVFLVPFFTKELEPWEYGVMAIAGIALTFIDPIATLGMDGALFRFYALTDQLGKKQEYVSTANALKILAVSFMLVAAIPLYAVINATFFQGLLTRFQFGLVLATFAFESLTTLTVTVLRSERKVMRIGIINVLVLVVSVLLSIYFVLILKMRIEGVLLAGLIGAILRASLYMRDMFRIFSIQAVRSDAAKELLSYGLPIVPQKIQSQAIFLFTMFMINNRLGIATAGLYAVAQKVSKPLSELVHIVQQSWTPYKFLIYKLEKSPQPVFQHLITFYWMLLLFLWGILSLSAPWVFRLLIDRKYWEGIDYVPFILFITVAQGFCLTVTTGFEVSKKQRKLIVGSFFGLAGMVLASFLTLKWYQPYALILCQSVAFFALTAVLFPEARRMIRINYPFAHIIGLFCFTSVCIGLGMLAESSLVKVVAALLLIGGFAVFSYNMLPTVCLDEMKAMWVRTKKGRAIQMTVDSS
jgi:O-antigen/teichoic acid export membrane protein